MPRIRVLLVDDAVVFRRLVVEELCKDPALEVVGTAPNGRIALAKLSQLMPDLVILDIEMPEMNGLETLAEIRKIYPKLPVIMFSALTERGAAETLEALSLGATDYFTKPSSVGGLDESLEVIRRELIPEIKALCSRRPASTAPTATPPASFNRPVSIHAPVDVIAIGTSTGGPNALAEVFSALPKDLSVPILIVQHMPPMFTRLLAERLSAQSPVKVQEAVPGVAIRAGTAWIAPGDYHMAVVREGGQIRLVTHQQPAENSCRPSVDVLFRSVAQVYGSGSLAVIMTGMGQDGLRGCEAIQQVGGKIIAQDEASSVVWGMPGAVVRAGLAERVVPLSVIANEMLKRVRR